VSSQSASSRLSTDRFAKLHALIAALAASRKASAMSSENVTARAPSSWPVPLLAVAVSTETFNEDIEVVGWLLIVVVIVSTVR
jgi:hypothetical protein